MSCIQGVGDGFLVISKPLLECRGRAANVNFRVVAVFFGDTCLVNDAFYKAFIFKGAKVSNKQRSTIL